ncbi:MAG: TlpA family protein disulfide reductase, partial [Xanthobacteraceae bacterium]
QERPDFHRVVINADLVPNDANAVAAMLAQTGLAGAENWMFTDGFVERLRYEIDPQWHGEIPRTMLIGPDGSITTIEGAADLEAVRGWLDRARSP